MPHDFAGTWDTSDTLLAGNGDKNPAGLSHFDLYVRDPLGSGGTDLPEPGNLALVGLALAALAFATKRRRTH